MNKTDYLKSCLLLSLLSLSTVTEPLTPNEKETISRFIASKLDILAQQKQATLLATKQSLAELDKTIEAPACKLSEKQKDLSSLENDINNKIIAQMRTELIKHLQATLSNPDLLSGSVTITPQILELLYSQAPAIEQALQDKVKVILSLQEQYKTTLQVTRDAVELCERSEYLATYLQPEEVL